MRTDSKRSKKTKDDVMTSTECSQSQQSTFSNSVQESLGFKMGRHFGSMKIFKAKSTPVSPVVLRKPQLVDKHARVMSVHVGWAQVLEELGWRFNKVS